MTKDLKKDLDKKDASPIKRTMLRNSRNSIVSVCVIAVIALVVGVFSCASLMPAGNGGLLSLAAGILNQDGSDEGSSNGAGSASDEAADAEERAAAEAAQAERNAQALADYETNRPSANDADVCRPVVREESGVEYRRDEVLISFDEGTSHESLNELISHYDFVETTDVSSQDLKHGFVKVVVKEGTNVLEASNLLENEGIAACPNFILHPLDVEDEGVEAQTAQAQVAASLTTQLRTTAALNEQEWMLDSTNTRSAWNIQRASNGKNGRVSVAVLDTGCRVTHEDLKDNIVATYNAVTGTTGADAVYDIDGHGTHVAGIVAANTKNSLGMMGTSSDAGLVIIRVKGDDGAISWDSFAKAYTWLLEDHDGNGLTRAQEYNVRVANISIGGFGTINTSYAIYKKIDAAAAQGILTVCAAGNNKDATPPYSCVPGDYATCFEVINLNHSTYSTPNDSGRVYAVAKDGSSNYNVNTPANLSGNYTKDISAPGTSIYSTTKGSDSSYGYKSGTSMASPAVAGMAALVFAYSPGLKPAQVQRLFEITATDLNASARSSAISTTAGQNAGELAPTTQSGASLSIAGNTASKWTREYGYGEIDTLRALQVISATVADKSICYLDAKDLELNFPDGTKANVATWNAKASSDDDKWTVRSSNPSVVGYDESTGKLLAKDVGTVTITVTYGGSLDANGSSHIQLTAKVNVTPLDFSRVTLVSEDPSNPGYLKLSSPLVYTGQELHPQQQDYKTASYRSEAYGSVRELRSGSDYTVSWRDSTYVGDASLILTPTDTKRYKGSKVLKYSIAPRLLNTARVEVDDQVYTGAALTPKPKVIISLASGTEVILRENVDYCSVSPSDYSNNTNVGTATVTIHAKEGTGFTGSILGTFKIKRNIATCSVTVSSSEYTGKGVEPTVTVKDGNATLVKNRDYVLQVRNNINVNSSSSANAPYVVITGKGEYGGSLEKKFSITPVDISNVTIASIGVQEYTGSSILPKPTVTYKGYTLVEGRDYKLSYPGNHVSVTNKAQVHIEGIGNFQGSTDRYFVIRAKTTGSGESASSNDKQGTNNPGTNSGSSSGTGSNSNQGSSSGTSSSTNQGTSYGNNQGSSSGTSSGTNQGTSSGTNSGTSQGSSSGMNSNTNSGTNQGTSSGANSSSNQGTSSGANSSSNQGTSSGTNSGINQGSSQGNNQNGNSSNPSSTKVSMYRLYNPNSGEHLYTKDLSEYTGLGKLGWKQESVAWQAPESGENVYRLYNPNSGDHHYTTDYNEYVALGKVGWKKEGVTWHSGGSMPVYRLFNPNATIGTHHYTTDVNEYNALRKIGWKAEGVGWYGL